MRRSKRRRDTANPPPKPHPAGGGPVFGHRVRAIGRPLRRVHAARRPVAPDTVRSSSARRRAFGAFRIRPPGQEAPGNRVTRTAPRTTGPRRNIPEAGPKIWAPIGPIRRPEKRDGPAHPESQRRSFRPAGAPGRLQCTVPESTKNPANRRFAGFVVLRGISSGEYEIRTRDLLHAMQAL